MDIIRRRWGKFGSLSASKPLRLHPRFYSFRKEIWHQIALGAPAFKIPVTFRFIGGVLRAPYDNRDCEVSTSCVLGILMSIMLPYLDLQLLICLL